MDTTKTTEIDDKDIRCKENLCTTQFRRYWNKKRSPTGMYSVFTVTQCTLRSHIWWYLWKIRNGSKSVSTSNLRYANGTVLIANDARYFLTVTQRDRWIDRGESHAWSARFPDSTPWIKSYGNIWSPMGNFDDLRNRIIAGCNSIRNGPRLFERIRKEMTRRLNASVQIGESLLENLL